jgi:hypothetical protein
MVHYFPLIGSLSAMIGSKGVSPVRVEAYKNLREMVWRCFKVFCKRPNEHYNYENLVAIIKIEMG